MKGMVCLKLFLCLLCLIAFFLCYYCICVTSSRVSFDSFIGSYPFPLSFEYRVLHVNTFDNSFNENACQFLHKNLRIISELFQAQNADFLRIMRLKKSYTILIKK